MKANKGTELFHKRSMKERIAALILQSIFSIFLVLFLLLLCSIAKIFMEPESIHYRRLNFLEPIFSIVIFGQLIINILAFWIKFPFQAHPPQWIQILAERLTGEQYGTHATARMLANPNLKDNDPRKLDFIKKRNAHLLEKKRNKNIFKKNIFKKCWKTTQVSWN